MPKGNLLLFTSKDCLTEGSKHETKLIHFNEQMEDDYPLWSVRVRTALRSRKLIQALEIGNAEEVNSDRAPSIIRAVLADDSFRVVKHCDTAKYLWNKLERL